MQMDPALKYNNTWQSIVTILGESSVELTFTFIKQSSETYNLIETAIYVKGLALSIKI